MARFPTMPQDYRVLAGFTQFENLSRTLSNVEGNELRVSLVADTLTRLEPGEAIELVRQGYEAARRGESRDQSVFLLLTVALTETSLETLREAIATDASSPELSDLFPRHDTERPDDPLRTPDFGQGRPLTLGERKSLARTRDRDLITRVVHDPHAAVIEILLDNPSLTENDVVRLCAKRPIATAVLSSVFGHRRWIFHQRVRNTLVRNPFCPLHIALQLTLTLNAQDQREICRSYDLHDLIRLLARSSLQVRVASKPP